MFNFVFLYSFAFPLLFLYILVGLVILEFNGYMYISFNYIIDEYTIKGGAVYMKFKLSGQYSLSCSI